MWGPIATIIIFLVALSSLKSHALILNTFYESGERNTISQFDEADLDYTYEKYSLKLNEALQKQNIKKDHGRITYSFGYNQESRNYQAGSTDLNNTYHEVKNKLEYQKEEGPEKRQAALIFDYKTKDFRETNTDNYNRIIAGIRAAYRNSESHLVRVAAGYKNYRFINNPSQDEDVFDGKIEVERYFGDLSLDAAYKAAHSTDNTFGTQSSGKLGVRYKRWYLNYLDGFRDSRGEEGDFDDDYRYSELNLGTKQPLGEKIAVALKYTNIQKQYLTGGYNNSGYEVSKSFWYYATKYFYGKLDLSYREKIYASVTSLTYYRNAIQLSLRYRVRTHLRLGLITKSTTYRFPCASSNNRTDKSIEALFAKQLSKMLSLELKYRYQIRDYVSSADVLRPLFRIGLHARFR
ncbi:MAG: hypothetical protein HQ596_03165 [Candidatus Saganbacteria bacterium]|nr:hypothetical protein [Candidatus Saganbacteria bacterium]